MLSIEEGKYQIGFRVGVFLCPLPRVVGALTALLGDLGTLWVRFTRGHTHLLDPTHGSVRILGIAHGSRKTVAAVVPFQKEVSNM